MLKITPAHQNEGQVTLKVEGRIVGEWASELRKVCGKYRPSQSLTLDLAGVTFMDDKAIALLREFREGGTHLAGQSLFISTLLQEGGPS